MKKVLIKVSNGSKVYIENVTHLINDQEKYFYREIKIKETDLEDYKNHLIYEWSRDFFESKNLPDWVLKSQLLEFIVINEY